MTYTGTDTTANEKRMLEGWLDFHRSTLERKCQGLQPDQMKEASVPPSNLTLLGLVRHLADVERHWFQRIFQGERIKPLYWTREDSDADFNDLANADSNADFAAWYAEVEKSREIVSGTEDLDTLATSPKVDAPTSLRWILVHLIEEYARHNGHADLLCEVIDGETGV